MSKDISRTQKKSLLFATMIRNDLFSFMIFMCAIIRGITSYSQINRPKKSRIALFQQSNQPNRRDVMHSISVLSSGWYFLHSSPSVAQGWVKFPCKTPLGNTYHFLRAGQSLLEEQDILSTNPLFITNREAALSDQGVIQIETALKCFVNDANVIDGNSVIQPTIIRYAIAASSTDTGNYIARQLRIGRDKIVPEYNYLEPRAIGAWDRSALSTTEPAVWAMDVLESNTDKNNERGISNVEGSANSDTPIKTWGRPPPNDDGTPNEKLEDVAVRLRQFLSVTETQYSGDAVLVVASDGTTLALLSCLIAGIPFQHVHELEFEPGEVRLNVTMESVLKLWNERRQDADFMKRYNQVIDRGKIELQSLRRMSEFIPLQDQIMENEQRQRDAVYQSEQDEKKRVEALQREERQARAQQIASESSSLPSRSIIATTVGLGISMAAVIGATSDGTNTDIGEDGSDGTAIESILPSSSTPRMNNVRTIQRSPSEDRMLDMNLRNVTKASNPLSWSASPRSFQTVNELVTNQTFNYIVDTRKSNTDIGEQNSVTPPYDELLTASSGTPMTAGTITAEDAMEAYLNQDDGGEGWLQVLSEMLDDEDE
jgi:Histidine phosphatase superfamily (branch 1)